MAPTTEDSIWTTTTVGSGNRQTTPPISIGGGGTEPDLEGAGWGLVLNPPMWPSGNSIDFRLPFVSDPMDPDIVENFVWPLMTEMFSHITLNGVTIYHREDDPWNHSPSNQDGLDAGSGSNPTTPILVTSIPDQSNLGAPLPDSSNEPDPSNEKVDALSRELHEAVTGAAPPDEVDQIRADLAAELLRVGHAEDAIEPLEQAVQSSAERLGTDDVSVLDLQGMLGRALTEASLFYEAEGLLHRVVDGRTRTLGPEDPQTLVARGNLLRAIGRGGRPTEALSMADDLLADRRRLLGPDHPSTLDTRGHRAQLLSEAGRDADAIVEMEHLLNDRIRVLGPNHPDVTSTRHNLAAVRSRSELSDPEASWWELQQNAVAVSDDLGPDHPDTLVAWGLVAEQLQRLGRDSEAVALLGRLVEARSRVLGPDAAQTLMSRRMLCVSQRRLGDVRQALAGVEVLESTALEVLGPASPLLQQIRIERIACLRMLLDEGDLPDPAIAERLEELIDQVVEADLDSEGIEVLLALEAEEPPGEAR